MSRVTYTAREVADLAGLSEWSVLQAARRGDTSLGLLAIRVGRRLVWPRAAVDELLHISDRTIEEGARGFGV
ncbi:MAG: hypothetical protein M0Z46_10800 [Actinomycetota bacterium]|nr:hypothetical protein [Actinomycetota bacterium]